MYGYDYTTQVSSQGYTIALDSAFVYNVATNTFTLPNVSWVDPGGDLPGMNSNGALAFWSVVSGQNQPILYSAGSVTQIPVAGSDETLYPFAINAAGEMLARITGKLGENSVILDASGRTTSLPVSLFPYGLGPAGQIVGQFTDSQGINHGAVYVDGAVTYLSDPNAPQVINYYWNGFGYTETVGSGVAVPVSINSARRVVGHYSGYYDQGYPGFVATPIAPAPAEKTRLYVDTPSANSPVAGSLTMSGWAISDTSGINAISVAIDGAFQGTANYGIARGDVCSATRIRWIVRMSDGLFR